MYEMKLLGQEIVIVSQEKMNHDQFSIRLKTTKKQHKSLFFSFLGHRYRHKVR
jgi:hypothetical protein